MHIVSAVPDNVARAILVHLCHESFLTSTKAEEMIQQFYESKKEIAQEVAQGRRLKQPYYNNIDLVSCKDCKLIYTKDTKRGRSICRFHPGKLIIEQGDEDWEEYLEETSNETIGLEQIKLDIPGLFKWDCCGRNGSDEECRKRNHHESVQAFYKWDPRAEMARRAKLIRRANARAVLAEPVSDGEAEDPANESDAVSDSQETDYESVDEESSVEDESSVGGEMYRRPLKRRRVR